MVDRSLLREYQDFVRSRPVRTKKQAILRFMKDHGPKGFYLILGLASKHGKSAEKLKKILRDQNGVVASKAMKELLKKYKEFAGPRSVRVRKRAILRLLHDYGPEIFDFILGLVGETGEFTEKVKRVLENHGGVITPRMRKKLLKELGDKAWYITAMAEVLRSSLEEVIIMNKLKLRSRWKRGKVHGSGDNR